MPARPPRADDAAARGPRLLQLLDVDDLGWIGELTDAVVRLEGQPWRVALDAIEGDTWRPTSSHAAAEPASDSREISRRGLAASSAIPAAPEARDISPRRLNAATNALRRLLAGRPHEANLARKARSLLLGIPALDKVVRAARIASVAAQLELSPEALDRVLWADVPRERPIELTRGRPAAAEIAAHANVGLLQRALARAHSLELVVRGEASPLLRGCAARGLIVTASQRALEAAEPARPNAAPAGEASETRSAGETRATVLDIVGPLALCHGTAVYGRALGNLVPLLASCESFAMTIHAEARGQHYELRVESPALLPAAAPRSWALVDRLANDLERLGESAGVRVWRAPPALVQPMRPALVQPMRPALALPAPPAGALVCPDLGIEIGDRRVWVEVVGFWTPEYLARKLARYRAVGAHDAVLCVDASRACDDDDPPHGAYVVRYVRRVHAEALLQLLGVA